MTIAEFFIKLGIKGADDTSKKVQGVTGRLDEVRSSGLAAKAMILGVVYGLQKMMSNSANTGLALKQFSDYTGMSADALQRWQIMFRMSQVSAEEVTGSLQNMQGAITRWKLGDAPPMGLKTIADKLGDMDVSRLEDATYLMGKLREYAKSEKDVGLANQMLGSFGLSPAVIAAMRTSTVDLSKIDPSLMVNQKQIPALARVSEAWTKFQIRTERGFDNFTAKHGAQLVRDITMIADKVFKLADAFLKLSEKIKFFEAIGKIFDGWGMIFDSITGGVDFFSDLFSGGEKADKSISKIKEIKENIKLLFKHGPSILKEDTGNFIKSTSGTMGDLYRRIQEYNSPTKMIEKNAPPQPKALPNQSSNTSNVNIKQDLIFNGDGKDAQEVSSIHRRAIETAYRQSVAQGMAT